MLGFAVLYSDPALPILHSFAAFDILSFEDNLAFFLPIIMTVSGVLLRQRAVAQQLSSVVT